MGNPDWAYSFTEDEHDGLELMNDQMYEHHVIRFNFLRDDIRRDQDSVNTKTHPDIMLLASDNDDSHPYLYARVIGIFHAQVRYTGPGSTVETRKYRRVDFLWVRWFELDESYRHGFQHRRLPRVKFVSTDTGAAFGFVDPHDVLRASYLMPAFDHGEGTMYLETRSKLARRDTDQDRDFRYYHVCM